MSTSIFPPEINVSLASVFEVNILNNYPDGEVYIQIANTNLCLEFFFEIGLNFTTTIILYRSGLNKNQD